MKLEQILIFIGGFITWATVAFTIGRFVGIFKTKAKNTDDKLNNHIESTNKSVEDLKVHQEEHFKKMVDKQTNDYNKLENLLNTNVEKMMSTFTKSDGEPRFLTVLSHEKFCNETVKKPVSGLRSDLSAIRKDLSEVSRKNLKNCADIEGTQKSIRAINARISKIKTG